MLENLKRTLSGGHRPQGEVVMSDVYGEMVTLRERLAAPGSKETHATIRERILQEERASLNANGTKEQIRRTGAQIAGFQKFNANRHEDFQGPKWDAHFAKVLVNSGAIASMKNRQTLYALNNLAAEERDRPKSRTTRRESEIEI